MPASNLLFSSFTPDTLTATKKTRPIIVKDTLGVAKCKTILLTLLSALPSDSNSAYFTMFKLRSTLRLAAASIIVVITLLIATSPTEAQTPDIGQQSPFPQFADFPLCSLSSFEERSTSYCINSISGEITSWGTHADSRVPDGSYYMVDSIKNDVNGTGLGGCAIRRNTFEVVCWGDPSLTEGLPKGLQAFRVAVGLFYSCALTFNVSLIDLSQLVLIDPNGQQAFHDSINMVCWGKEYFESNGESNFNFPLPSNPGNNPPVELYGAYKYVCAMSVNGLYNCGGLLKGGFSADIDVSDYVDTGVALSVLTVNRDRFCFVETDGVTMGCRGVLCNDIPEICAIDSLTGEIQSNNDNALAVSFNGGCMINSVNELECFSLEFAPPSGKFRQIYATTNFPDNYCGIRLIDGVVECFGPEDTAFPQPPEETYFISCTQNQVVSATLLELVDSSVNPYRCIENGRSSLYRLEWDISGPCQCYPRLVSNLFSYDRNQGTCGISPYMYVLEAANGNPDACRIS